LEWNAYEETKLRHLTINHSCDSTTAATFLNEANNDIAIIISGHLALHRTRHVPEINFISVSLHVVSQLQIPITSNQLSQQHIKAIMVLTNIFNTHRGPTCGSYIKHVVVDVV
jgi:hypothetical protein